MPISPSIPTSFVPKQSLEGGGMRRRGTSSGNNIFLVISLIIFGLSVIAAGGVFGYQQLLQGQEKQKDQELQKAEAGIDQNQIQDYVRLQTRINAAKDVLDKHIIMSQFFDTLEATTIQSVSFTDLKVDVADDRSAKITLSGTAKTFNALAAESNAFAAQKFFKRAIFANIVLNSKDNSIGFSVSADIDPALFTWNAATVASSTPVAQEPQQQPAVASTTSLSASTSTLATPVATTTATTTPKKP